MRTLTLLPLLLVGCAAASPSPSSAPPPSTSSATTTAATADEPPPQPLTYPEIAPKDLGMVNGKAALFKHAYLTHSEGMYRLQAFTMDDISAAEDCRYPNGMRFVSEGSMLQVDFSSATAPQSDVSSFALMTDKPAVKVTKAAARIQGDPKPGTKVMVDVTVEGSNGTKLKGTIEAVVCAPPPNDG